MSCGRDARMGAAIYAVLLSSNTGLPIQTAETMHGWGTILDGAGREFSYSTIAQLCHAIGEALAAEGITNDAVAAQIEELMRPVDD